MANAVEPAAVSPCPDETLFVELVRAADLLSRGPAQLIKGHQLSLTQYNVLRILRGSPDGLLCGEVAGRMITRDPDITRLLGRLEKRGLITRSRQESDRRMVMARITPAGLELLSRIDGPLRQLHRRQFGRLSPTEVHQLAILLVKAMAGAS